MRHVNIPKTLMAILAAGSLALGAGLAVAASTDSSTSSSPGGAQATQGMSGSGAAQAPAEKATAAYHVVRGKVTAVEATSKELTVQTMHRKKAQSLGIEVPDTVKITEGKATKTLADVKVGDRVWMKYDKDGSKLTADEIHILPLHKMATKKSS